MVRGINEVIEAQPRSVIGESTSPYSLAAMLDFVNNNAGLLFLGASLLIVGFLTGAMWRENTMLKSGYAAGTPTAQAAAAAPGAAAPGAAAPAAVDLADADWKAIQQDPAGVIGKNDAKVTMVEFTDYQCPFCSRFYTTAYKTIKEKYINTGKLKVILKDQPLTQLHPNAKLAANAARCGGDQGKQEAMHDQLFGKQADWASLSNDDATKKFGDLAKEVGLDGNKLTDCIKSGKFNKAIEADAALGLKVGASGTPTFFVNKKTIVGAQDASAFEQIIDAALKN